MRQFSTRTSSRRPLRRALEAQAVIFGIDQAVADDDPAAAIDVAAIVVEIDLVLNPDVLNQQVIAMQIILHPAR